ncbi:MAG: hypothetical protein U5K54_02250 [Cytophagales bacterium]|nr:hypothetical protein [Cytophagales bacterium]
MKYSPLVSGLLILFGFIPKVIGDNPDYTLLDMILPVLIAILFFALFFNIRNKLRYVAIGISKVIIKKKGHEIEYNWLDVEKISLNHFFGLYELKIKNEELVYFTPYGMTTWLTGDSSDMGVIINKMKRELQI